MKGIALVLLLTLSGCSWLGFGDKTEQIASGTEVNWQGGLSLSPHPEAEAMLTTAFRGTEWEGEDLTTVLNSRGAVTMMFEYMEIQTNLSARLPYYMFRNGFFFVQWLWKDKMQPILEAKVIDGELSESDSMIYYYVSRDIDTKFKLATRTVQEADKDIAAKSTQADIDMLTSIYDTIKPLMDFL